MKADRHLLFGLLALQNEFIDKRQLVAAFKAWMADHSRPLDEILVQQHALKEDDRAVLSRLVDRHIAARGDVIASLRSLSSVGSIRDELAMVADHDVTLSLAQLRPVDPNKSFPSMGQATSSGQRFEIRRLLDRGGLGIVSVALDKELNREVALKEIRDDRADDQAYRTKFVLEAEVTGGLEHPGIVPVYGLGTKPDGRPYYAMRLIKGDNLLVHIKRFHEDVAAGKEPFDGAALRKLLRRFLDVCQAIDYAHSRGVLHRDLKPGNIMLGKYGETLVVDWGLAKPMGAQHREPSPQATESCIETPLIPSGSNDNMTVQGSIVGTAAYASPEQLSGDLDQVNERSDVYGLGAILFELLTGQSPAQGDTLACVIETVLGGNVRSPRSIQPKIPKSLEAICKHAIATRPEDRYATAAELRLEIERWLDDEPVEAYRETWSERLGRSVSRSHEDVQFRDSGNIVLGFACVIGTAELATFFLTFHEPPHPHTQIGMIHAAAFAVLVILFRLVRPKNFIPKSAPQRLMMGSWLGFLLTCCGIGIICQVLLPNANGDVDARKMFPFFSITSGLVFVIMGSAFWGICYLFGLLFFVLSIVMLGTLKWAGLEFAIAWIVALSTIGMHLRRIGSKTSG